MRVFVILRKNQLNGKSAVFLTVRLNGLKENGANVQHHAGKTERGKEKFTVKKSALTGDYK